MNKKSLKQYVHEALLLLGASVLACAVSYLLIWAGAHVEYRWHIGVYVLVLFMILPGAAYVTMSWFMWLLERIFSE